MLFFKDYFKIYSFLLILFLGYNRLKPISFHISDINLNNASLIHAIQNYNFVQAKLLINAGADISMPGQEQGDPLQCACYRFSSAREGESTKQLIKKLIHAGAPITDGHKRLARTMNLGTAFHFLDTIATVDLLLKNTDSLHTIVFNYSAYKKSILKRLVATQQIDIQTLLKEYPESKTWSFNFNKVADNLLKQEKYKKFIELFTFIKHHNLKRLNNNYTVLAECIIKFTESTLNPQAARLVLLKDYSDDTLADSPEFQGYKMAQSQGYPHLGKIIYRWAQLTYIIAHSSHDITTIDQNNNLISKIALYGCLLLESKNN